MRRFLYACGSAGFQLGERTVISLAIYFYMPPAGRGLETQVSDQVFLGGLTAFGLAMLIGRAFDAVSDPLVAQASDSSTARFGRRRIFLLCGALPMTLIPVLLFWPPGEPGSLLNFWWLAALLSVFFVAFTVYVAPYLALIPEIAHNQSERLSLATVMAIVAFPVIGLFSIAWPWVYDAARAQGLAAPDAMRLVVVATAVLALGLCLLPVFAIDERRHTRTRRSELALGPAMRATIVNRPFAIYLGAQTLFIVGINLVHPSIVYYATVVLGRTEGFTGTLGAVILISTALAFLMVKPATTRLGAKRAIMACVLVFALGLFALGALEPGGPGSAQDARNLTIMFSVSAMMGIPLAGFLVLPHVLISQVIDRDQSLTGANRAAMFFGVQGLLTKMMYGVSAAILAYLFARYGNSAEQPLGVLLVGPVAGTFCLASVLLFTLYPEKEVLDSAPAQPAH